MTVERVTINKMAEMTMNNTPIDSKSAGQRNERMILFMLRKHGRLSQTQLCRMAGIGSSTASTIVARLREKGLVNETRGISQRRGPKPTILELNPDCRYVIAVEINPSYLYIGLFDFLGSLVDKIRITLGPDHSTRHVLDLLSANVPAILNRNELDDAKVLGAGVTLSGSVMSEGRVSLSSPMGWKDVPLKEELSSFFSFPVTVHSNRVRLLAEFALNPELASKNILYLNLANGVDSTIYMDGRLVFGATGRYGEIGHIVIDPEGPVCGCGHKGCLEAFISGPSLVSKIQQDMEMGVSVDFLTLTEGDIAKTTPEDLLADWAMAAENGDEYAIGLRDFVADHFARAAAMLVNCYDPDVVILAGYVSQPFADYFADCMTEKMKTDVYDQPLRQTEVLPARSGEDALINGVANAVLQDSLEMIW
jgi:predicted NBD/HSP70 family sugar kinase